jgi:hypothetical protein
VGFLVLPEMQLRTTPKTKPTNKPKKKGTNMSDETHPTSPMKSKVWTVIYFRKDWTGYTGKNRCYHLSFGQEDGPELDVELAWQLADRFLEAHRDDCGDGVPPLDHVVWVFPGPYNQLRW